MENEFDVLKIQDSFQHYYPAFELSESFIGTIINVFSVHFSDDELADFMITACERTSSADSATRYFCGICWKRIKSRQTDQGNFKRKDIKFNEASQSDNRLH